MVRGKTSLNPVVQAGFGADGSRLRAVGAKRLKAVRIRKKGLVDFDVVWGKGDKAFSARLIASWNRSKREYRFLVTNLPRSRYSAQAVDQAYRLRWQIELLFKEWKSYANLHAFNTANPAIAEGLVWAAIGAAAMKRYLAHMTQVVHGVQVSTRKVAMCAHQMLGPVIDALIAKSSDELHETLRVAVEYLATNALRAHPKRERRTGRLPGPNFVRWICEHAMRGSTSGYESRPGMGGIGRLWGRRIRSCGGVLCGRRQSGWPVGRAGTLARYWSPAPRGRG